LQMMVQKIADSRLRKYIFATDGNQMNTDKIKQN
jgi:hypothetical protein